MRFEYELTGMNFFNPVVMYVAPFQMVELFHSLHWMYEQTHSSYLQLNTSLSGLTLT